MVFEVVTEVFVVLIVVPVTVVCVAVRVVTVAVVVKVKDVSVVVVIVVVDFVTEDLVVVDFVVVVFVVKETVVCVVRVVCEVVVFSWTQALHTAGHTFATLFWSHESALFLHQYWSDTPLHVYASSGAGQFLL